MPYKPKRPCAYPTCPNLVTSGYCDKHKKIGQQYEKNRGTAAERGYDRNWWVLRRDYISSHPYCVRCGLPAQVVDHIVPKRDGGRDEWHNLQSLCHRCHNKKHKSGSTK